MTSKREDDLLIIEKDKQRGISPKNTRKDERRSSIQLPITSFSNPVLSTSPNIHKDKPDLSVSLRDSSPASFGNTTQILNGITSPSTDEIIMCGWMKIRNPMKMWMNRYFVLKPGKLIFYKDTEKDRVAGVIKLVNCDITEKGSNQNGSTFKLTNKIHQCIYERAGFTEKSIKFTTNMVPTVNWTYCVFRVLTTQQRTDWINAISTQIHFANTHSLTKHETAVALTTAPQDENLNNNNVEQLEMDEEEIEETDDVLGMKRERDQISRELAENLFQQNEALHKTLMEGLFENQKDVIKVLHQAQLQSAEQLTKDITGKVTEMQNKLTLQTLTALGVAGHKKNTDLNLTFFQFVVLVLLALLAGKLSDRHFTSNQEL